MLFYELLPSRGAEDNQQRQVKLPDGAADYATLQKAIAGAMATHSAANGSAKGTNVGEGNANVNVVVKASPAPGSLRIRPRTVHRWSTPPVA